MSLEKSLKEFMSDDEGTPVDVLMKLLDPQDVVMQTEVHNVGALVAVGLMEDFRERQGRLPEAQFWHRLRQDTLLLMVSKDRKREKALVKMFSGMAAMYGYQPGGNEKSGFFGSKK